MGVIVLFTDLLRTNNLQPKRIVIAKYMLFLVKTLISQDVYMYNEEVVFWLRIFYDKYGNWH